MDSAHKIYISLGSNIGNRKAYLQRAIVVISRHLGQVTAVSNIYETPAWGFDSSPFYNACIEVITKFSAEDCLQKLLYIETILGRTRDAKTNGYQARTIDLDILFYDNCIIDNEILVVPHPYIPLRKFVLKPLMDIASELQHPTLHKTITELYTENQEDINLIPLEGTLFIPKNIDFINRYQYISIEGNIGAGKTSLATQIAEDFAGKLILERYFDNPFLEKFYIDSQKYGFITEVAFLTDRYDQIQKKLKKTNSLEKFTISDYDVTKSLIFASVTLPNEEFELYRKIFYNLHQDIKKPNLYIYLLQNTKQLLKNIEKRGRTYEKNISDTYLNDIQQSYISFLEKSHDLNVLWIDVSELNFVENQEDYHYILALINQHQ